MLLRIGYEKLFINGEAERWQSIQLEEMYKVIWSTESMIMKDMLSDEVCMEVIDEYYYKIIKKGDYYTFDVAKRIIEEKVSKWEKVVRLTDALKMISDYGGIAKAKAAHQGKKLAEFRRSLRELEKFGINPVTIPREWGIDYIPNLLYNYYSLRAKERERKEKERFNQEALEDYIKDCRKSGKSWI